jgi:hypothetical protein
VRSCRAGAVPGILAACMLLAPASARSAEPSWSFSMRGGFIVPAQSDASDDWFDMTPLLLADLGRKLGAHLSLLATTGYMRSPTPVGAIPLRHTQGPIGVGFASVQEGTLVPLALGLRYYPVASTPAVPRPYLEISPALYWLYYETRDGQRPVGGSFSGTNASDQVLAAGGLFSLVVPGRITSRLGFEIGFSYLLSETFEGERGRFPGLNHASMLGGLSFGL